MTTTKNTEKIHAERQVKLDRKIERMRAKATRLERDAEAKMADFNRARQDWAWVTQPGHIPGRKRITDRYNKGLEMAMEARELREKADYMERNGPRVAGDAERRRQRRREAADALISKGTRVNDVIFGKGVVIRVNKKSYTIQFDRSGSKYARDKSFVRPLPPEEGPSDGTTGTS